MGRDTDHTEGIKSMKDDMISRQAAIDALEKVAELFPWKVPGNRDSYDRYNEAWNDAIGRAEIEIEKLPSAQPTDAEIQRMQDIEQAMLDKAYECGKQDAQEWIPCKTAIPEKENTRVTYQTNAGVIIFDGIYGGIDAYGHRVWLDRERGLYWDDEVVAWMPIVIPEPWKGEKP